MTGMRTDAATVGTGPALARPGAAPRHRTRRIVGTTGIVVALVAVAAASVAFGSRDVTVTDVWRGLAGHTDTIAAAAVNHRVPRTLLALLVGAALAVGGATLQGAMRNPLADPQLLGVTGGASLAIVTGIAVAGLSSAAGYIWLGMTGAAVAAAFVFGIASLGRGGPTPLRLTLAGAVTAIAFGSLTSAILLPRIDVMSVFRFWQIGGVGGATLPVLAQVAPFLLVGFVLCLVAAPALNTLALGDELAAGLGTRVHTARLASSLGAVILCGAATAVAGPIGFLGLVVPHMVRLISGPDHRLLLLLCAPAGAVLLTAADVLGRVVARPGEIEVGIVTAVIGAPVFIALVRRQKLRAL